MKNSFSGMFLFNRLCYAVVQMPVPVLSWDVARSKKQCSPM